MFGATLCTSLCYQTSLKIFGSELNIFFFTDAPAGGLQQETGANEQETHQLCSHPEAEQRQPDGESL